MRPDEPIDPSWPPAYHLLHEAKLLADRGDKERAIARCRLAAELSPDDGRVQQSYGWFATNLGLPEEALGAMRKAVELDGTDPANWTGLAYALAQLSSYAEAVNAYRQALVLTGRDDPEILSFMAVAVAHERRSDEAVALLQRAKAGVQDEGGRKKLESNPLRSPRSFWNGLIGVWNPGTQAAPSTWRAWPSRRPPKFRCGSSLPSSLVRLGR